MPLDLPAVIKTAPNRQMAGFISRQPAPIWRCHPSGRSGQFRL